MNVLQHFIIGLRERYPLCCIISFCLGKNFSNGVVIRNNDLYDVYKPCFLHKHLAISDREYMLLLNDGDLSWIHPNCFDENGNWKREAEILISNEKLRERLK